MEFYGKAVMGAIRPVDEAGEAELEKLAHDAVYKVKVTRSRSLPHHRLYFALLQKIYRDGPASERFPSFDAFRDTVTIGAGWFEWMDTPGGRYPRAKSIAWHKMDQTEFNAFFEAAVDCISDKLGLVDAPDLKREFDELLTRETAQ